jgi:hypothetical protein
MIDGWIKVYSSSEEYQAEIIKSLLIESGLSPVILDRKDDSFRIGNVDVYTAPEEAEKALEIIDTIPTGSSSEEE